MAATLTLTDNVANALAASVAQGVPFETAAQAAGIGPSTLYSWLEVARHGRRFDGVVPQPDNVARLVRFGEQIARAQADWEAKQVAAIVEDAAATNAKTGLRDWRARAWLLNNHPRTRARYRQENQVKLEHSGAVQHEHTLAEGADDDQLRSWAALELPAPTPEL